MTEKDKEQLSLEFGSESKTVDSSQSQRTSEEGSIEWICHPAKRNLRTTILVTAFLMVVVAVVYFAASSVWFGILAFIFLFGSLASFYFPTRYKMSEKEIVIKTKAQTLVKKWSQYRTYYPDKNGVLLSPFARKTRLENFRGTYIRFESNREEVVNFVKRCMDARAAETSSGE